MMEHEELPGKKITKAPLSVTATQNGTDQVKMVCISIEKARVYESPTFFRSTHQTLFCSDNMYIKTFMPLLRSTGDQGAKS